MYVVFVPHLVSGDVVPLTSLQSVRPTVVSLIADADHSAGAVAVSAAEPRAGLADVNMIYGPALTLPAPLLLDPTELSGSTRQTASNTQAVYATTEGSGACSLQIRADRFFLVNVGIARSYPEETWSGSWTVTLVHVELLTGL